MYTILKVNWNPETPMPSMREMWPLDTDEPEEDISQLEVVDQYKKMMEEAAKMYENFK